MLYLVSMDRGSEESERVGEITYGMFESMPSPQTYQRTEVAVLGGIVLCLHPTRGSVAQSL